MPFEKKDSDDMQTLTDAMRVLGAVFKLNDLDFDFDEDYSEEDNSKDKLMEDVLESMNNIAEMYGELYKALLKNGFSSQQAFELVKIYSESLHKVASK